MKSERDFSVELVSTSKIFPSVYNPRKADQKRLDILELSLRKLGFILPIYAERGGEILSGHQRHFVTTEKLKWERVPLYYIEKMEESKRKTLNISFNRGTNDFSMGVSYEDISKIMSQQHFNELCENIPDKKGDDRFRCANPEWIDVEILKEANSKNWSRYAANSSKGISQFVMNIVCTKDNKCVNGIGRLQNYIAKGMTKIPVVYVTEDEQKFADIVLNYLTMDFDIHNKYGDILRYNSFRRKSGRVANFLSSAFCFTLKNSGRWNFREPKNNKTWKSIFGTYVLDFGAGTMADSTLLNEYGVKCVPFEPYQLNEENEEINIQKSKDGVLDFLAEIEKGKPFTALFMNAILNSVPFESDRMLIVKLLALLSYPNAYLYTTSAGVNRHTLREMREGSQSSGTARSSKHFELDYEKNVTLADFNKKPKMQKHFEADEWKELWLVGFKEVKTTIDNQRVTAICRKPILPNKKEIKEICKLEFELPYPDDTKMGLAKIAEEALNSRIKHLKSL